MIITLGRRESNHAGQSRGRDSRHAQLFSDDATALIHTTSRGLPRAVNNLAIEALIAAYASRKAIIDESSARTAAAEVTSD